MMPGSTSFTGTLGGKIVVRLVLCLPGLPMPSARVHGLVSSWEASFHGKEQSGSGQRGPVGDRAQARTSGLLSPERRKPGERLGLNVNSVSDLKMAGKRLLWRGKLKIHKYESAHNLTNY